ncbi:carbohydrate ABC transporter permease [Caproicibacter sp.]|uniref:carbohydrate ABC transporter permease n=1 Tax=Caproicibacter sp. TaxID=2814884 RepID=UPI003989B8CB
METIVKRHSKFLSVITFLALSMICVLFLLPILAVLMNSFKGRLYISDAPFSIPSAKTFAGFSNYQNGIQKIDFFSALGYSFFITLGSVVVIVFFTAMTAWYITRVKTKISSIIYLSFVFSMIVPFQMVMFTMSKIANILHLDNPVGIIFIYLGFGAGLSTFLYSGFIKSIPLEIEEAAMIDGCNPLQIFFKIVFPILKPIVITVGILNTMWIWNDYLLPVILIGSTFRTIPIAIQYLQGGYGSIDMGAMMAMLVLAIIPIVIFYSFCQRYIIEGVVSGAVKG